MHADQIAYQLDYLTTKRLKPIDTMNTMKTMMAVAALALATGSVQALSFLQETTLWPIPLTSR